MLLRKIIGVDQLMKRHPHLLLCSWFLLIIMNYPCLFFVFVQYFPFLSKIVKKNHQPVIYLTSYGR